MVMFSGRSRMVFSSWWNCFTSEWSGDLLSLTCIRVWLDRREDFDSRSQSARDEGLSSSQLHNVPRPALCLDSPYIFQSWGRLKSEHDDGRNKIYRSFGVHRMQSHSIRHPSIPQCWPLSSLAREEANHPWICSWRLLPTHCIAWADFIIFITWSEELSTLSASF